MALLQVSPQSGGCKFVRAPLVAVALAMAACPILTGCGGGPGRVDAPDWDSADVAASILEELDKNGDGAVDAEELKGAPGLASGVRFVDADKDGKVTAEEIEKRFDKYAALRIGIRGQSFRITHKGRPVANAEVRFLPEGFLKGVIEPAAGTTDEAGIVAPITEGQDLRGMRIGYYRVQIVSGGGKIPDAYRTEASPLGADVSLAEDESSYNMVELKITD